MTGQWFSPSVNDLIVPGWWFSQVSYDFHDIPLIYIVENSLNLNLYKFITKINWGKIVLVGCLSLQWNQFPRKIYLFSTNKIYKIAFYSETVCDILIMLVLWCHGEINVLFRWVKYLFLHHLEISIFHMHLNNKCKLI